MKSNLSTLRKSSNRKLGKTENLEFNFGDITQNLIPNHIKFTWTGACSSKQGAGISTGVIITIVVGIIFIALLIGTFLYFCYFKKKNNENENSSSYQNLIHH